jgi:hypothetical protein
MRSAETEASSSKMERVFFAQAGSGSTTRSRKLATPKGLIQFLLRAALNESIKINRVPHKQCLPIVRFRHSIIFRMTRVCDACLTMTISPHSLLAKRRQRSNLLSRDTRLYSFTVSPIDYRYLQTTTKTLEQAQVP